ncbi:hypothetical protein KAR91_26990, partial [Candidatus Pacearchaeota archaeon]|nr:hypothetical protein [Candidatus Pacearchaeota archaeon]
MNTLPTVCGCMIFRGTPVEELDASGIEKCLKHISDDIDRREARGYIVPLLFVPNDPIEAI